jgi:parallel beta-helix repeat protein
MSHRETRRASTRRVPARALVILAIAVACTDPTSPVTPRARAAPGPAGLIVVGPTGLATGLGTTAAPLSLERAVASAPAGSVIQMLPGTYRTGGLVITKPLTIVAAPGAKVAVSGSEVIPAGKWQQSGRGWRTPLVMHAPPSGSSNGSATVATDAASVGVPGQVARPRAAVAVADGHALEPVGSPDAVGPNSFYVDAVNHWVYVGRDPARTSVEVSTQEYGMFVASSGVRVSGLSLQHYATAGLRVNGSNVQIDHNNISNNAVIGLDLNGGSNVLVQDNTLTYNGQVGLEASYGTNVTVANNNISHNNTRNYDVKVAASGLKGTQMNNFVVRGNWVADNASNALWVDANSNNTKIVQNTVLRNKCFGIYIEISSGVIIAGNVVHDNVSGIGVHFTKYAKVYNNTLVNNNTHMDISASYNRAPYDLYHTYIVNNLMGPAHSLMSNLYRYNGCNSTAYSEVDYNGYYRSSTSAPKNEVNWCNSWYTKASSFHSARGYEAHGLEIDGGGDPFFVSVSGGNFRLHSGSPAIGRGQPLPSDVAAALGVHPGVRINMGAAI